jgi:hypothetical protein
MTGGLFGFPESLIGGGGDDVEGDDGGVTKGCIKGGAVTVISKDLLTKPALFEAVSVYVVELDGDTVRLPSNGTCNSLINVAEAPSDFHFKEAGVPCTILVLSALNSFITGGLEQPVNMLSVTNDRRTNLIIM